ncbi:MAG: hypothetical protein IPJ94_09695 [Chloroflexi bacterium]|nr:hypothetical protein [Chloroflexota bacterium]
MKTRQRFLLIIFVLTLLVVGIAAAAPTPPKSPGISPGTVIVLKPQQTLSVSCLGDELIVVPSGDLDAKLTCRVWMKGDE